MLQRCPGLISKYILQIIENICLESDLTVSLVAFHWKLWSLKSNIHQSFYPNITPSQYIDVEIWKYTRWLMTFSTYCRLLLLINQFQWAALRCSKAYISYFHTHTITKRDFHVFNLIWTCCEIQYGTKCVAHHLPGSCSVTAEASDESDTHVVCPSHAHSNGFIKPPRCLALHVYVVRLCVTQYGSWPRKTQASRWRFIGPNKHAEIHWWYWEREEESDRRERQGGTKRAEGGVAIDINAEEEGGGGCGWVIGLIYKGRNNSVLAVIAP